MAQWARAPAPATSAEDEFGSQHPHGSLQLSVAASAPWAFVDIRHVCGVYTYTQGHTRTYED